MEEDDLEDGSEGGGPANSSSAAAPNAFASQGALGALADAPATGGLFGGLSPEALMKSAREFIDPSAKNRAMAAGFLSPKSANFSESFGAAMTGYNDAATKEAELVSRYLPVVQRAAQQRQQMQSQAQARARGVLDATASAALLDPDLSSESLAHSVGTLARQGQVPGDMAAKFLSSLPKDSSQLRRELQMQAIARSDPLRAVRAPTVEKYREGEVGFEVDPVTRARKEVGRGEAKATPLSKLLNEMMTLPPGDPRRARYEDAIKKATTHPPAASMTVNAEKPLADTIAKAIGESAGNSRDAALTARSSFDTATQLLEILKSPNVNTGPGAEAGQVLGRIAELGNWGGKDNRERLANSTAAIKQLAQLELDAAAQMKGQGAITESERALLKRVASGQITDNKEEIRALAILAQRQATRRIQRYNDYARKLTKMKGLAPLAELLEVEAPNFQLSEPVLRFDAQGRPVAPTK